MQIVKSFQVYFLLRIASECYLLLLSYNLYYQTLCSSYYGPKGIGYTVGRVPMGGCDFSPRPYTYADSPSPGDLNLTQFRLQEEDYKYKVRPLHLLCICIHMLLSRMTNWPASFYRHNTLEPHLSPTNLPNQAGSRDLQMQSKLHKTGGGFAF
jgi:hypothetical protein